MEKKVASTGKNYPNKEDPIPQPAPDKPAEKRSNVPHLPTKIPRPGRGNPPTTDPAPTTEPAPTPEPEPNKNA